VFGASKKAIALVLGTSIQQVEQRWQDEMELGCILAKTSLISAVVASAEAGSASAIGRLLKMTEREPMLNGN
jgi:hypothetical protein